MAHGIGPTQVVVVVVVAVVIVVYVEGRIVRLVERSESPVDAAIMLGIWLADDRGAIVLRIVLLLGLGLGLYL